MRTDIVVKILILILFIFINPVQAQNIAAQGSLVDSGSWYNSAIVYINRVVDGDFNTVTCGQNPGDGGCYYPYTSSRQTSDDITYLQLDLGAILTNLSSIQEKKDIWSSNAVCQVATFNLKVSTDNTNWTTLRSDTAGSPCTAIQRNDTTSLIGIPVRYIRSSAIKGGTNSAAIRWYEIIVETINIVPSTPQISHPTNNGRYYNNSMNSTWNQSVDANNDSLYYEYWLSSTIDFSNTINRTNFTNNWTTNIATTDGVTYYEKVRTYDGYGWSDSSPTVQFTENTAPVVNITTGFQPALIPTAPSVTDNITAQFNVSDAESDTLTKHYLWYKNGVLNTSWNDSVYVNFTGGNLTSGDSIYFVGFANDGYENGSTAQSNTVIIGSVNSAPSLSGITLNPSTQKYNKTIWINSSTAITDTESSKVRLLTYYKYTNGTREYLGNSSWIIPSDTGNVSVTIPWRDGALHTIYAQAEDSGNITGYNNLTSSEVSTSFTSSITPPTVTASSINLDTIYTGGTVIISANFTGVGANVSSAIVQISRPDATTANWTMTCGTAAETVTCTKSYAATSDVGTYTIDYFYPLDDSGDEGAIASILSWTASTEPAPGSGGGGGSGGSTTIVVQNITSNATNQLTWKNITTGATESDLTALAKCLTDSLVMKNYCSGYNYGVVVEPFNWWVFMGAFIGAIIMVFVKAVYDDKPREWFTEPALYTIVTIIIVAFLVSMGANMYILNYLLKSPEYFWTFLSLVVYGAIVGLAGDEYFYKNTPRNRTFKLKIAPVFKGL